MSHNNVNTQTNTTQRAPRISRVVPSNNSFIGLIIKHDLTNIRKKVGKGIFIRYNDERAPGKQWYLEAYLKESLDSAQNLLRLAEKKYLLASQPRQPKKAKAPTEAPTHQNQFSALAAMDAKKEAQKELKRRQIQAKNQKQQEFEQNFPSLAGPAPQPAAPVWVKDPPQPQPQPPKKATPQKPQLKVLGSKLQVPGPNPKLPEPDLDDWEHTEPPQIVIVPDAWDNDWYDQIPGAH